MNAIVPVKSRNTVSINTGVNTVNKYRATTKHSTSGSLLYSVQHRNVTSHKNMFPSPISISTEIPRSEAHCCCLHDYYNAPFIKQKTSVKEFS